MINYRKTNYDNANENKVKGDNFEKYIGHKLEKQGFMVNYNGLNLKKKDGGIDLIAYKDDEILLVQCKCYAKTNFIYENTIHQLYGSKAFWCEKYKEQIKNANVYALLVTSSKLDYTARCVAKNLDIQIVENEIEYPEGEDEN